MALGVDLSILNQRGTPAFFSDIFANRPAFGFAGRVFISTDTGAIYEDTGTAWTLIADAGAGTTGTLEQVTTNGNTTTQGILITAGGLTSNTIDISSQTLSSQVSYIRQQMATNDYWKIYGYGSSSDQGEMVFEVGDNAVPFASNGERFRFSYNNGSSGIAKDVLIVDYDISTFNTDLIANNLTSSALTTGSVLFAGASGLVSQKNSNLFWDNTNNRLGIGNAAPGAPLDIHGTGTNAQFNGTGTNNAYLQFQNAGTSKWRIGNTYAAGANNLEIYNNTLATNAITVLNSNNYVGIGTSPSVLLHLAQASAANQLWLQSTTGTNAAYMNFKNTGGNNFIGVDNSSGTALFATGGAVYGFGMLTENSYPLLFGTNNIERARFFASTGNFSIGTTTDAGYKLDINGTGRFSGRLLVSHSTASNYGAVIYNTSASGEGLVIRGGSTSSHNSLIVQPYDGSVSLLSILATGAATFSSLGTGTVTATSGTLSTVSDMNLKIEDGFIDNALSKVMNLKPRYFKWKKESGLPTDIRQLGFYAQEVNQALGEEAANTPNDNKSWGITDRSVIAMLTKAIQELKAEIDQLKNN